MAKQTPVDGQTRLKNWMKREGLNQRDLARLLGVHFTNVNHILTGRRGVGSVDLALRIEDVTGVPVRSWASTIVDYSKGDAQ